MFISLIMVDEVTCITITFKMNICRVTTIPLQWVKAWG
jgi:hypothetical protein